MNAGVAGSCRSRAHITQVRVTSPSHPQHAARSSFIRLSFTIELLLVNLAAIQPQSRL